MPTDSNVAAESEEKDEVKQLEPTRAQFLYIQVNIIFSSELVWRNGRAFDPGPRSNGFEPRSSQMIFS